MSDYCQPPYVSASLRIPRPRTRRAVLYTAVHARTVDAELSHDTHASPPPSAVGPFSAGTLHREGQSNRGLSCPELQRDSPPPSRRGREGKALRTKQLLIRSSTGGGGNLTSCRCCHGYQSPMCHSRLVPRPCPDVLPFTGQRKGTKGIRRRREM